jgi:hypothetical protein
LEDRLHLRASEWADLAALDALRNEKIAYQSAGGNKYYILEGVCSHAHWCFMYRDRGACSVAKGHQRQDERNAGVDGHTGAEASGRTDCDLDLESVAVICELPKELRGS